MSKYKLYEYYMNYMSNILLNKKIVTKKTI